MIACAEGSVESVRMMLKEGVITSHKDVRNRSCLFYALDNRGGGGAGIEIMKMLLAADQSLVLSDKYRSILLLITTPAFYLQLWIKESQSICEYCFKKEPNLTNAQQISVKSLLLSWHTFTSDYEKFKESEEIISQKWTTWDD